MTSGKLLHSVKVGEDNDLNTLDFNSTGHNLACGGKDGIVRVFDEATKVCEYSIVDQGAFAPHSNRIFCVKFNPFDNNQLISAGWDNSILFNDLRTAKPIFSLYGPRICGETIDFSPTGVMLTGSNQSKEALQLWDMKTRKVLQNISWGGGFKVPTKGMSEVEKLRA